MECRYCQAANASDDHRCRRCGRRLPIGPVYTGSSAAAPVLQYEPALAQSEPFEANSSFNRSARRPEPSAPRRAITYQPSLFTSRELPVVVPFETIAPDAAPSSLRKSPSTATRQRRRKVVPGQQALEFTPESTQPSRLSKPADGVIYCDAPVAIPAHRAMAAALDGSIVVIAITIFGIIFHLSGGAFVLNINTAPMFLGVTIGIVIFYRLLWCLANGDTVGQQWTRLRLVNFDGQPPTRQQRFYRTMSGFLSLMAAGIGLLWSLVDEETLTWHDHISKTFPTPVN